MAKRIALYDHIEVDGVDLSNFARSVEFEVRARARSTSPASTRPAPTSTWPGRPSSAVTVEFFGSYGATEVHADVYPIHATGSSSRLRLAAEPERRRLGDEPGAEGQRAVPTYSPAATRGEAETDGDRSWPQTRTALAYHTT